MPSFDDLGGGRFEVRVRVKNPVTGEWGERSRTVSGGKREAVRVARELESAKDRGLLRAGRAPTVEDFAELWLAGIKPTVAYETHRGYAVNVHRHIVPLLGRLRLRDLGEAHVRAFIGHMLEEKLSARTVQYARAVLHMILERALDDGLVSRNVAAKVKPPTVERKEKLTLTEQQLDLLLREAEKTRLIAPVVLAGTCGLRRGEICGLRWENLDLDEAEMMIAQTLQRQTGEGLVTQGAKSERSRRRVPLLPFAVPYLRRWRARQREERLVAGPAWRGGDFVCTTLDGGPLDPSEFNRRFRRLVDSIGLPPVVPHGLRHTFATLAIKNGADFKWVQAVLGHKSAAFTLDVYVHVTAASLQETAKALDAKLAGRRGVRQ